MEMMELDDRMLEKCKMSCSPTEVKWCVARTAKYRALCKDGNRLAARETNILEDTSREQDRLQCSMLRRCALTIEEVIKKKIM